MDDHRRSGAGYAATVAVEAGGGAAVAVGATTTDKRFADTELATGTGLKKPTASEKTGPVVGGMIGRYAVTARVGQDPIGVVFAARDEGRAVAIKLVHATVAHMPYRSRLVRDAPGLAQLAHPSLVQIEEIGVAFGRPFIAMEFVEGPLLSVWLQEKRPWRAIAEVFAQIGDALATAHRAGFGHGDWTLECVLVEPSGRPRVIDVGLGRFDPSGTGRVDARVDQLRFAVALRGALGGGTDGEPALWAMVPEPVRAIVARAVDDASANRFPSMTELGAALDAALGRRRAVPVARAAPLTTSHGARATPTPTLNVRRAAARVWLPVGGVLIVAASAAAAYALMSGGVASAPVVPAPKLNITVQPIEPAPAPAPAPTAATATATPGVGPVVVTTPVKATPSPSPLTIPAPSPLTEPSPSPSPLTIPSPSPPTVPAPTVVPTPTPLPAPPAVGPNGMPVLTKPDAIWHAIATFGYGHIGDQANESPPGALTAAAQLVHDGISAKIKRDCGAATKLFTEGLDRLAQVERTPTSMHFQIMAQMNLGLCALLGGNYAVAKANLRAVVPLLDESDPDYRQALLAEAIALWQLDDPGDARAALDRALAGAAPTAPIVWAYSQVEGPLGFTRK